MESAELVVCRGLQCGYGQRVVVEAVDLEVRTGEIVTILGGSGSGKSTLLETLAGLRPPLAGSVCLLGQDPYALRAAARRRLHQRIGMLYQGDALLGSMTVLENVMLPLEELTDLPRAAMELSARARLALVDVLETQGRLPSQISGGQSKRVALARATILDPLVLFCDEPTSALDPLAAAQVDEVSTRLRDALQMGIIAVTHDPASVRRIADRVIVLADGRVQASGSVSDIEREVPSFFERSERRHERRRSVPSLPISR